MNTRTQKALARRIELQLAKHEAKVLADLKTRLQQQETTSETLGIDTESLNPSRDWPPDRSNS